MIRSMKNFLSESERIELRKQHKHERDKKICDRIKAILLYDKGWTLEEIAETLLLSHEGIRKHLLDYETIIHIKVQKLKFFKNFQ